MGIKLYNKLPLELRNSDGCKDFKHKLKLFLLDHPFYTLTFFYRDSSKHRQNLYSATEIDNKWLLVVF
jgi:hypothetical protein